MKVKKTEGIKNAEIKFSLNSSQITEILNSALSEFKYGEHSYGKYWVYAFDEEFVYLRDSEDGKNYRSKYQIADLKASVDVESKEEVISGSPIPVEEKAYIPEFAEEEIEPDKGDPKEDDEDKDKEPPADKEPDKKGDEDKPKEDDKKNMSLDENLNVAAFLAMLADETEAYQALVAKHQAGEDLNHFEVYGLAYQKMCKMADELKKAKEDNDAYMSANEELKKFKAEVEAKQFAFEVESTLAEVSETMPKAEMETARENSKNFNLETVNTWKNEVKALAFSFSKKDKKIDDGITRFATSWVNQKTDKDYTNGWVGKAQ